MGIISRLLFQDIWWKGHSYRHSGELGKVIICRMSHFNIVKERSQKKKSIIPWGERKKAKIVDKIHTVCKRRRFWALVKNRRRERVVKLMVSFINELLSKVINAQKNAR